MRPLTLEHGAERPHTIWREQRAHVADARHCRSRAETALDIVQDLQSARRPLPDTFYGVGANTPHSASEPYTADIYELELSPRFRLVDSLYAGPSVRVQTVELAAVEAGGLLAAGTIPGSDGGTGVQLGVSAFYLNVGEAF